MIPKEIGELCERLRDGRFIGQEGMRAEAAAALERLARENESLEDRVKGMNTEHAMWRKCAFQAQEMAKELEARIGELEAERDQFMEAAAIRDQRDIDMQEIMRVNNELLTRIRELEAEVRTWKVTAAAEAEGNREHLIGWEKADARIRELEAERDRYKEIAERNEVIVFHKSDCAINNHPAYPAGECTCGAMKSE